MSVEQRRQMVTADHANLPIVRQCELLAISRPGYCYDPVGESAETLALMRLIDEAYLAFPYYGSRQMTRHLGRLGQPIGRKRIRRLMAKMGMAAIHRDNGLTLLCFNEAAGYGDILVAWVSEAVIAPSRWSRRSDIRGISVMLDFGDYNLYAMAADPLGSAMVRKSAHSKLELGDEDAYHFLKKLAEKIEQVAGRYTASQLKDLSDKYENTPPGTGIKRKG